MPEVGNPLWCSCATLLGGLTILLAYPEVQVGSDRATAEWHGDHQLTSLGRERKGMASPCICSFQLLLLFSWRQDVEAWKTTFLVKLNNSNVTCLIKCHQKSVWAKAVC